MKKNYSYIIVISTIFLSILLSCNKKGNEGVEDLASQVSFHIVSIGINNATFTFYTSPNGDSKKGFYKKITESTWTEYTAFIESTNGGDIDTVKLSGLDANTEYEFKVDVTSKGKTASSKILNFKTIPYELNFSQLFSTYRLARGESVYGIEGVIYTINGKGFLNVSSLDVQLQNIDDNTDVQSLNPTILNDTTITIQIPSDLIPNTPYVKEKKYYLSIDGNFLPQYLNSSKQAILHIYNRDIHINNIVFDSTNVTCRPVVLQGFFGNIFENPFGPNFYDRDAFLNIPTKVEMVKVKIYDNNNLPIATYETNPMPPETCDGNGFLQWDDNAKLKTYFYYHESVQYNLKTSSLSTGTYKVVLEKSLMGGETLTSNAYELVIP